MNYTLLQIVPKKILSKMAGILASAELPPSILHRFISAYCQYYQINQSEMIKRIDQFSSFNEFFTRKIDVSKRPIDKGAEIVASPVDASVGQFGTINNLDMIQAKGIHYSLKDLIGNGMYEKFIDGSYVTLYLSPANYHRIHSPFDGTIDSVSYFSGNLWPVNEFGVENIGALFSRNERLISYLDTKKFGSIAIVKVAALIVGNTKVHYSDIETNKFKSDCLNVPVQPVKKIKKGDELGYFKLGSTVILLFEKNRFALSKEIKEQSQLLFGQKIGSLK